MKTKILIALFGIIFLSSCSTMLSRNHGQGTVSSSLVDFLYPGKTRPTEHEPEIPVLKLPVNVGLAFVPSTNWRGSGLTSNAQIELLEKVKKSFIGYDYINRIEVIPSVYLNSGKNGNGFSTLEQVARLHDVDVMALVSYDQVAQSFENNAALLYWTIVGMYVIPGNDNSIQTFVDTAVFDVKSRKLLFRAPGIDRIQQISTAVGVDETLSKKSYQGFNSAVTDMTANLDLELARFKDRVRDENIANIELRDGYSGGGAVGLHVMLLALLSVLGGTRSRWTSRHL